MCNYKTALSCASLKEKATVDNWLELKEVKNPFGLLLGRARCWCNNSRVTIFITQTRFCSKETNTSSLSPCSKNKFYKTPTTKTIFDKKLSIYKLDLETFRNFWEPFQNLSEPLRAFRNLSEPLGTFWNLSKPSGTFRNLSELFRTIW